ncbi:histidinol-phosphate transaminase [Hydrogeniiclostridium mannosilyticum]|uniref:histidinol-phosphate transaminase n=1 Tax=Hydrogeniiclostridium mannosilyticum TaxID=2764322 RepID=UPI0018A9535C|nr:histidinol-phosphate transaminase [Hydrogeniiclostridium mannosilyticum]
MYQLNEKIRDLKPYDPISGDYAIRLDANESFLPLPDSVLAEMAEAVQQIPYNRYPDPLASALCQSFAEAYCLPPELVTAGNGSDELISMICTAFLMRGERAMTVEPDFSMYRFYAALSEAEVICFHKDVGLKINTDALIRAVCEQKVRLLLFSNPCNPTSLGLKKEDVRKLVRSVPALVVLDEAYMDFWDQSLLQEVEDYDNLLILRTCSKALGMAGIRLGFAVANPTITNALRAVKSPYNVNALTQALGVLALRKRAWEQAACEEILASKHALYQRLKELELRYPSEMRLFESCTNFVFVKMKRSRAVFEALLQKGIAVRFMGDYLRITAGSPAENAAFLTAFEEALV